MAMRQKLNEVTQAFMAELQKRPELTRISTFFRPTVPQLFVEVDEQKALALGLPIADIYSTLQSTMGALYVNDFNKAGRVYRVQLQAEANYRMKADDIGKVYVRSTTTNAMVPLSAVSKVKNVVGPEQVERFNGFIAAKVMGDSKPGISSGDAIRIVEEVADASLPDGYGIAWTGQAFQEKRTSGSSLQAFGFAIIMVFLILAAQYEKWSLPVAVVMAVPFALMGALTAIWLRGMPNDIYFQIGLVVLIGLASKNAILIVEFAAQKYAEGMSAAQAAIEAARLRLRPIIMTSLAFVLGVFPLVKATGAGASARQSMGTGVFGGMLAATFIATLFIPLFFKWLERGRANRSLAPRHHRGGERMISRTLFRLTPLALAVALSGCAIGPDYLRPASLLPGLFGDDKPAESVAVASNPALNPTWWMLFNDATLDNLVDQALKSNASLRQAVARVEQADALARQAGASFFPEIDGSAGLSNTKASTKSATYVASQPAIRHTRTAGLSTSFELDVWGVYAAPMKRLAPPCWPASIRAMPFASVSPVWSPTPTSRCGPTMHKLPLPARRPKPARKASNWSKPESRPAWPRRSTASRPKARWRLPRPNWPNSAACAAWPSINSPCLPATRS